MARQGRIEQGPGAKVGARLRRGNAQHGQVLRAVRTDQHRVVALVEAVRAWTRGMHALLDLALRAMPVVSPSPLAFHSIHDCSQMACMALHHTGFAAGMQSPPRCQSQQAEWQQLPRAPAAFNQAPQNLHQASV